MCNFLTPLCGLLAVMLFMACLWIIQVKKQEADIVDVGWTICVGALGLLYAILGNANLLRRELLGLFIAAWSLRLSWYLYFTRFCKPGEDGRYVDIRARWGDSADRKFFIFFQAQALLAWVLAFPFLVVACNQQREPGTPEFLAVLVWLVALGGEALADKQLHDFKSDPLNQGKTCRQGLWCYSRHPNYFFEWTHWWSYVLLGWGASWWVVTLIGPALMLFLILKVTGIPPTEERALQSRGDDYRQYQQTTSAFFPWFQRKPKG